MKLSPNLRLLAFGFFFLSLGSAFGQLKPAPADMQQFVQKHFQAIRQNDQTTYRQDFERGSSRIINDTLLYFKTNVSLQVQSVQYKEESPNQFLVIVTTKSNTPSRMHYDLMSDPQERNKLRSVVANPERKGNVMVFRVRKKGGQYYFLSF